MKQNTTHKTEKSDAFYDFYLNILKYADRSSFKLKIYLLLGKLSILLLVILGFFAFFSFSYIFSYWKENEFTYLLIIPLIFFILFFWLFIVIGDIFYAYRDFKDWKFNYQGIDNKKLAILVEIVEKHQDLLNDISDIELITRDEFCEILSIYKERERFSAQNQRVKQYQTDRATLLEKLNSLSDKQ